MAKLKKTTPFIYPHFLWLNVIPSSPNLINLDQISPNFGVLNTKQQIGAIINYKEKGKRSLQAKQIKYKIKE